MNGVGIGGSESAKKCKLVVVGAKSHASLWLYQDGRFVQGGTGALDANVSPGKYTVKFGFDGVKVPLSVEEDSEFEENVRTVSRHLFDELKLCEFLDEVPREDLVWIFRDGRGQYTNYVVFYRKHELKRIK